MLVAPVVVLGAGVATLTRIMSIELRPGLLTPTHTYLTRLIAYGLGCGLIGASLMFAAKPPGVVQAPPIALTETVVVPMTIPMMVATDAMPAPSPVAVVVSAAGASYMKLADLPQLPRHGKPKLIAEGYGMTSIAAVADADVAPFHRAWLGQDVIVDGTCRATVTGFAIYSHLVGDTGYASEDIDDWTAANVMRLGAPMLAARLDGCTGELARAASLSPMVIPDVIEDKPLATAAKKRALSGAGMKRARAEWAKWEAEMQQTTHSALDFGDISTKVVRHPTTGQTFVSVHATTGGGCGYPEISIWALYRADADGKLTEIPTKVGELLVIDRLVDVEGDGQLEVVGRPWIGTERIISRLDATVIDRLERPFFGCAC